MGGVLSYCKQHICQNSRVSCLKLPMASLGPTDPPGTVNTQGCSAGSDTYAACACCVLQGLAVHGHQGQQLSDASLPPSVVSEAFEWCTAQGVSCVAFLGDECATLQLTDDLVELHTRWETHVPQASVNSFFVCHQLDQFTQVHGCPPQLSGCTTACCYHWLWCACVPRASITCRCCIAGTMSRWPRSLPA